MSTARKQAQGFLNFVNASPTPYHVVDTVKHQLDDAGFVQLSERTNWGGKLKTNSKYYVTRNGSSLIAFTVGGQYKPGNGFAIVGGHTDSPALRVKPISDISHEGFVEVGVETYGGGLFHTWFDRDLSLAGRVFVKDPKTGDFVSKLIKIDRPLLRIPTLAIHLTKDRKGFEFNRETQFKPIAGLKEEKSAEAKDSDSGCCHGEPLSDDQFQSIQTVVKRHNKDLVQVIATELGVKPESIEDFELLLFDTQKSCFGGINEEFIFSPRLDNQVTCYCATEALIASTGSLESQRGIQLMSLFDHEEIGSQSAQGADSSFLPDILHRLALLSFDQSADADSELPSSYFLTAMSKSFIISSDMAHGVHPNYAEHYEALNKPHLNEGPVIKINANQKYVTNSAGIVLLKQIANISKTPLQLFVIRNDSPCGSTIGPMVAAKLGIRTLDIGNPQLSMHSIRETCGVADFEMLIDLFASYYEHYFEVESKILV